MSARRIRKQATYAGLALVALGVIASIVWFAVTEPAPSVQISPSPTPINQSLIVEQVDFVQHPGSVDVVARVRNPNPRAGVSALPVTFVLLNQQQQEVGRHTATSFIVPGSLQYVVGLQVPVQQPVASIRAELPTTPVFAEIPSSLDIPTFGVFLRTRSRRVVGNAEIEQQIGIIRNTSTFNFQRVELVALAHDANGAVVGVSKTFVGELKVGEQREFTVQWPALPAQTVRVTTLPSVNIFLEENIIQTIGDPRTLQ